MANWRDRRPSDNDIPSTEDFLREFHKRGSRATKVRHTVVRDEPEPEAEQRRDEVVERSIWAKMLIRRDWILAGLVCLVLVLQIWHIVIGHRANEGDDPSPEPAGDVGEQSQLDVRASQRG